MREPSAICLNLESALDLVRPYDLRDVLSQLEAMQYIHQFWIVADLVRIIPNPERRFDLTLLCDEFQMKRPKTTTRKK